MTTDINARLINCFSIAFPQLSVEEIPRANVNSVASWDSLATLTLMAVIEEEFGVTVDPRDREELTSFGLLLDHVRSAKGEQ